MFQRKVFALTAFNTLSTPITLENEELARLLPRSFISKAAAFPIFGTSTTLPPAEGWCYNLRVPGHDPILSFDTVYEQQVANENETNFFWYMHKIKDHSLCPASLPGVVLNAAYIPNSNPRQHIVYVC